MPSSRAPAIAASSSGISSFVEAEARQPELRAHAVPLARLAQQPREAAHERARRLVPVLPVRIGRERRQARQLRDDVPVGDAVVALGRRQQADRVLAAARGDVRDDLAQEVDDRRLAERLHLRRQLAGHGAAEPLGAMLAAARPARRVVDADVRGHHPRGLVPEHRVDAALEHPVGPLLAERAVRRAVQARAATRRPSSSTWHSSGWNVTQRLSASPPNVRPSPHGLACTVRPAVVRRLDDLAHRAAVVREVVLRERVQHAGVAARGEVGQVAPHVPDDADAEVRAACARGSLDLDRNVIPLSPSPRLRSARRRSGAGRAGRRRRPGSP